MDAVLVPVTTEADVAVCEAMWVEYADWATAEYVARFGDIVAADHEGLHLSLIHI